jgi:nitrogen regulatory protein PII
MDILKEKLGAIVLPLIEDFVTEITKPGGLVEQVGKFLEDLSNPKTEAGQMFVDIKNAVKDAYGYVKDFFALFGGGDAMEGFKNVATNLIKALPALLALKGILMLASAGKAISNLAQAVGLIQAKSATSAIPAAGAGVASVAILSIAAVAATQFAAAVAVGMADASVKAELKKKGMQVTTATSVFSGSGGQTMSIPNTGNTADLFGFYKEAGLKPPSTTININVQSADPKAVVDAVVKYQKTNGGLPWQFAPGFSSSGR